MHPILVTLGTKSLIDGISIYLTRGMALSGMPESLSATLNTTLLGVPLIFLLLIVVAVVIGVILRHTPFGVACAMIGSNLEATRYSAVDTRRVLVGVYVMSSVTCFFAALVMLATFNSASADYAQSYLLVTILAAVLGGVDPFGGFGTVSGLMLALAILQVISSGLNQFGLSNYLTVAIWGATLIGVVVAQTLWSHLPLAPGRAVERRRRLRRRQDQRQALRGGGRRHAARDRLDAQPPARRPALPPPRPRRPRSLPPRRARRLRPRGTRSRRSSPAPTAAAACSSATTARRCR